MGDRVGLSWRGELAASILERLDRIDALEVLADDWLEAPRAEQLSLRALAAERPLYLHGVSLGMASSEAADERRIGRMARLVERVQPLEWSEHLAFVRAGGTEVGHLAAPPRTAATLEGACRNIERARRIVGSLPHLENIATLVQPPAAMGEGEWITRTLADCGAPLLLDLHNLHANAINTGVDGEALLLSLPLERVSIVHIAGGRWIRRTDGRERWLDDHLHDVPDPVFTLLEALAASVAGPLTVILERDGRYPAFDSLMAEVERARAALATGRRRAARLAA